MTNIPTITIDMNKACAECGMGGAAESGICIACTGKAISGKPMKSESGRDVARRFRELKRTLRRGP